MADFSIKAFFGGDTSGLRAALDEANRAVGGFVKETNKAGLSLGKGFGFGILLFQAKRFFTDIINDSQKTREEFERIGKTVPDTVRSVAYLADGIDSLKKTTMEWGTSFLSVFTRAGEGIGMVINRMRGVTREMEIQREESARAADKLEKDRDKAYANREATEKKLAEQRERAAKEAARLEDQRAEKAFDDLVKVGEAQAKLNERKKDAAYQTMTVEQQILADQKELLEVTRQIAAYKKNGELSANDQLRVIELENKQMDINVRLAENRLRATTATVAEEKKILQATREEYEILTLAKGIRGGEQFNEASDESLAEVVRRNRQQAQQLAYAARVNMFVGSQEVGSSTEAARLELEARNAENELRFRRNFRSNLRRGGVEAARRSFEGDPLQFDRILQQLTTGLTVGDKQLSELEKLRRAVEGKFVNQ